MRGPLTASRRELLALSVALTAGAALRPRAIAAQLARPVIAVSMPLLADIARNVAGDAAEVYAVMPESADPHTWEATPRDLARVSECGGFISMGASLEPFVEAGGWRRAVRDEGVPELILAEHLDLIAVDKVIDHGDHVHDLREGDPHVWLDPRMVIAMLPALVDFLAAIHPDGRVTYEANAAVYATQLEELDAELERDLATIPPERRTLIVFHDAFAYFAARFGFEVVGVVLASHNAEPSARELADLLAVIEQSGVRVIFAEPQFDTDVLDVLAAEHDITIGELLTDAFAGHVETYLELMRFNRDSLVARLAG